MRTVQLASGQSLPVMGQGTWRMGEDPARREQEGSAIRLGVELGMTLIDTAEMYGDGATESFLGEALGGLRDRVQLVSKAYPQNAGHGRLERACEASLRRLRTDHLDLYLLHWRGGVPLPETVEGMEALVVAGKIGAWGVSNFDTADMQELQRAAKARAASPTRCSTTSPDAAPSSACCRRLPHRTCSPWPTAQSSRAGYPQVVRWPRWRRATAVARIRWRSRGLYACPGWSRSPKRPQKRTCVRTVRPPI